MSAPAIRIISLGAGLQSSTMALMSAFGEIGPMPDAAIFADTGNEKRATYEYLDWLEGELPFPIHRVRRFEGDLASRTIAHLRGESEMKHTPAFFSADGMLPLRCSKEWKTRAVQDWLRAHFGLAPGQRAPKGLTAEIWMGFTTDEAIRVKPSELVWIKNRWPLLEIKKHRQECGPWLVRHGMRIPPRSACWHCGMQSAEEFAVMAAEDFEDACRYDDAIRDGGQNIHGPLFVSPLLKPLREIDFAALVAAKADGGAQLNMFINECEGACGV